MTVAEFAQAAYAYCVTTNGSVTSWFRTRKHNAAVGGLVNSSHVNGVAVDVVYDSPVDYVFANKAAQQVGLLLMREEDHDHLQPIKKG